MAVLDGVTAIARRRRDDLGAWAEHHKDEIYMAYGLGGVVFVAAFAGACVFALLSFWFGGPR